MNPPDSEQLALAVQAALARTPARLMVGRSGPAYRTETWLKLRADHAIARDAVQSEIDLALDFPDRSFIELRTKAHSKAEYLMRPDLGRKLSDTSVERLRQLLPQPIDVLFLVGDGLSATAVRENAGALLDALVPEIQRRGLTVGPICFIHSCRVGILNDFGEIWSPKVAVLLIGERPGLATASSLSAYLAYQPNASHSDAQRNLISNIHANGVTIPEATPRLLALIDQLLAQRTSGVLIKEYLPLESRMNEKLGN